jgi:hypothetical protein
MRACARSNIGTQTLGSKDVTHVDVITLEREGADLEVTVEIEWRRYAGEPGSAAIEPGWYVNRLEARDAGGVVVALSENEEKHVTELLPP